jgi:hypothetical protein
VQAPGDEERCALRMPVREMALIERHVRRRQAGGLSHR